MRHLTAVAALILALAFAGQVRAVEVTTEQSDGSTVSGERSYTGKSSLEDKDSAGKKRNKSKTTGSDQTSSSSKKKSKSATKGHSLDMTVNLLNLFNDALDKYTRAWQGRAGFAYISVPGGGVVTNFGTQANLSVSTAPFRPYLPADFGFTAVMGPGVIDTVKADLLPKLAASNAEIGDASGTAPLAVRLYVDQVAFRGAIIAQAANYLAGDIESLQGKRPGVKGEMALSTLGFEDLRRLADDAVRRAMALDPGGMDFLTGITDPLIIRQLVRLHNRWYDPATPESRFAGTLDKIMCQGDVELVLGAAPKLTIGGAPWYDPASSTFAGYSITYKVSSSWSLVNSLEALKSSSKYSKQAYEISAYAEQLEAKGRTQEAAALRKQAVEAAEHNKASLNPVKFLHMPGAASGGE